LLFIKTRVYIVTSAVGTLFFLLNVVSYARPYTVHT
jgi:hypothetical protein